MAKRTGSAKKPKNAVGRLIPRDGHVVVRMYRIGHGDCFLLAFPGPTANDPVYVLIDCGYKPGSPAKIPTPTSPKEVAASLKEATGGHIHVVAITHEHQDHVNAITAANFKDVSIGEAWFAWTEDPTDDDANKLRTVYRDRLLGLAGASRLLGASGDGERSKWVNEFLSLELGGEQATPSQVVGFGAAATDPEKSQNKQAMKRIKDLAGADNVKFLSPHEKVIPLPGSPEIRVFALGPPRSLDSLQDLDPQADEEFHMAAGLGSATSYFAAAARLSGTVEAARTLSPFSPRYSIDATAMFDDPEVGAFFRGHYGLAGEPPSNGCTDEPRGDVAEEVEGYADWRRIETDWLFSAEHLALAMNGDTNNASLVLAFELGKGGKVLLFAGDAQRGNWVSWADAEIPDGDGRVTARDLLGRTVLYKVGHHCSHNATLNGEPESKEPCLGWMARGAKYEGEFTAMITAVRKWAETQNGWDHPRKEIKDALIRKASGRVLQTDTDLGSLAKPAGVSAKEWAAFLGRVEESPLYFDLTIEI